MKESLIFYKAWSSSTIEYGSHWGSKRDFQRVCKEYKKRNLNVTTITKMEYNKGKKEEVK